ncbi:hypothetical protein Xen7305DRAFT_00008200 [Xenococcus sp. PCC 7305]|uniref:hypothetical protein n=1 Tax=Xenococcus sp. PCC 7305 TaxID=102125 RepID=UPI0002ABE313|nr:hypothetical protein [Xenococcus sp. PCC 7305]ELS01118.1 hypothetical protein Xen7305DRAFT_00008200 [Xenococcus sp. PCC 7305]
MDLFDALEEVNYFVTCLSGGDDHEGESIGMTVDQAIDMYFEFGYGHFEASLLTTKTKQKDNLDMHLKVFPVLHRRMATEEEKKDLFLDPDWEFVVTGEPEQIIKYKAKLDNENKYRFYPI